MFDISEDDDGLGEKEEIKPGAEVSLWWEKMFQWPNGGFDEKWLDVESALIDGGRTTVMKATLGGRVEWWIMHFFSFLWGRVWGDKNNFFERVIKKVSLG